MRKGFYIVVKWFVGLVFSTVISSIVSSTVVSFVIRKLTLSIDFRNNGIKCIHPKGQSVRSMTKMIKSDTCKEIRVLGLSALGFSHSYRSDLTNFIASGGNIKYLLSKPEGQFVIQASQMEGRPDNSIADSVKQSIDVIRAINEDAKRLANQNQRSCGTIELRYYDTEIRNQLILCIDNKNKTYAWLTIFTPPSVAVSCQMIEYVDAKDCVDYFNIIWQRHENDVVSL